MVSVMSGEGCRGRMPATHLLSPSPPSGRNHYSTIAHGTRVRGVHVRIRAACNNPRQEAHDSSCIAWALHCGLLSEQGRVGCDVEGAGPLTQPVSQCSDLPALAPASLSANCAVTASAASSIGQKWVRGTKPEQIGRPSREGAEQPGAWRTAPGTRLGTDTLPFASLASVPFTCPAWAQRGQILRAGAP